MIKFGTYLVLENFYGLVIEMLANFQKAHFFVILISISVIYSLILLFLAVKSEKIMSNLELCCCPKYKQDFEIKNETEMAKIIQETEPKDINDLEL